MLGVTLNKPAKEEQKRVSTGFINVNKDADQRPPILANIKFLYLTQVSTGLVTSSKGFFSRV